jgi:hypothetical protein
VGCVERGVNPNEKCGVEGMLSLCLAYLREAASLRGKASCCCRYKGVCSVNVLV